MSKYGTVLYGSAVYGGVPLIPYSVEPMGLTILDFTKADVSWQGTDGTFTRARLLRSQTGVPETAEDGVVIAEYTTSGSLGANTYRDGVTNLSQTPLVPGKPVYYAMYLFTGAGVWLRAGLVAGVVPSNHGMQGQFMGSLPRVFTSSEQSPLNEIDTTSDLWKFMDGLSFTAEEMLTYIDLLGPGNVLNYDNVGMTPEPNLPTKNQRMLIREAIRMYSMKGTPKGLELYCESLTGYAPTLTIVTGATPSVDVLLAPNKTNLMKNPSFEVLPAAGIWNETLTGTITSTLSTSLPTAVSAGVHSLHWAGTTSWTATMSQPVGTALTSGKYYTLSFYAKNSVPVTVHIAGSTISVTDTVAVNADWTRSTHTFLTPLTAAETVTVTLSASAAGSADIYFDAIQLEESFKATEYFDGSLPDEFGVVWAGPITTSVTYQYFNKDFKFRRLSQTIKDWIPPNVSWTISTPVGVVYSG